MLAVGSLSSRHVRTNKILCFREGSAIKADISCSRVLCCRAEVHFTVQVSGIHAWCAFCVAGAPQRGASKWLALGVTEEELYYSVDKHQQELLHFMHRV